MDRKACIFSTVAPNLLNEIFISVQRSDNIVGHLFVFNKMGSTSALLLQKQLKELQKDPVEGFSAGLNDDNIYHWEVVIHVVSFNIIFSDELISLPVLLPSTFKVMIMPTEGSLFEGAIFIAELTFPENYPTNPPEMRFVKVLKELLLFVICV